MKKKEGTGSIGYMLLFGMALIIIIVVMYLMQVAKLMTHQHNIDDALADSVLASLVADDIYYFETYETLGTPIIRFRDKEESKRTYDECMAAAISGTEDFYYNFEYEQFILYEVDGNSVRSTIYTGNGGVRTTSVGTKGNVFTPGGAVVKDTSAYAKVKFDIRSILDGSYITKYRDFYGTLEIN